MPTKRPVAVLISGSGSNLQALIDACAQPDYPARIVLVLSNKADAYGLRRAEAAGIPTEVISHKDYPSRAAFEEALDAAIRASGAEIVCLAGFMRILEDAFVQKWQGRMLNIHPSLLPKYKGLHTHQRALDAGDTEAGCTVHLVVPEMDSGPIIKQATVPILPGDTAETLAQRVLAQEHIIYPEALKLLAEGKI
jgi:phosphoribosylglycinamide formyltransferase 1